ncbi:MAG: nitroreductase family protein [Bacteroidaceae bacterium]|nr:nitroreductase family protein [Bacteroidaceae bacterium]
MDSFKDLVKARRSMRQFTEEKLTEEQVRLLLRAALIAPSSKHTNGWEFVVVDDRDMLVRLSESRAQGAQFIAQAALAVVVLGNPSVSDAWIEDASIAAIMMQLQAEDLGLGSCWAHMHKRFNQDGTPSEQIVCKLLGVPEPYVPLCIIGFGHKGMERKEFNEDHLQWEKVHTGKF